MKKFSYFVLAFSFGIFVISLIGFYFNQMPVQVQTFYTSVNFTSDSVGFDVNNTALTFGNVIKGGSSSRKILFQNEYPFPVIAEISAEGDIEPYLAFDNYVFAEEEEIVEVPVIVSDLSKGDGFYSGEIEFKIKHLGNKKVFNK